MHLFRSIQWTWSSKFHFNSLQSAPAPFYSKLFLSSKFFSYIQYSLLLFYAILIPTHHQFQHWFIQFPVKKTSRHPGASITVFCTIQFINVAIQVLRAIHYSLFFVPTEVRVIIVIKVLTNIHYNLLPYWQQASRVKSLTARYLMDLIGDNRSWNSGQLYCIFITRNHRKTCVTRVWIWIYEWAIVTRF